MANAITHPQVLTVEEAADVLRLSRAKLYALVRAGQVPHRNIAGTGVRFTTGDVEEILRAAHRPVVARRATTRVTARS